VKSADLLRGPVARVSVRGRASGNGRRSDEYIQRLHRVALGTPGRCPSRPVLVICNFDDSGSVSGGNDPLGHRYDELSYALEKVGRRCSCGECMAAIVHFDIPTDADVPPTPITRKGMKKVAEGLRVPARPSSSSLGSALNGAYQIAGSYKKTHDLVLVVATDFELFDSNVGEVMQRVVDFPGDVHALVLNTQPLAILSDSPSVTVSQVDPRSSIGDVAMSVFATITRLRAGAKPTFQADSTTTTTK
jgi:hypothetical protein